MSDEHGKLLGQQQSYPTQYDASLLQPIPRADARQSLPKVKFWGVDIWTAFEISYLNLQGKPRVAIAEFTFPADSTHIVESKSFKYYLNSFNQTRLANHEALIELLDKDLSAAAGSKVIIQLFGVDEYRKARASMASNSAINIDELALNTSQYKPNASLLKFEDREGQSVYCSHLLKSNCPVTGQPDWASVWVGFSGRVLKQESLLAYIVSFRQHQDFHEHCVERMYSDLWSSAKLDSLWVYARYTRRGGLDINPFRSSHKMNLPKVFAGRQ